MDCIYCLLILPSCIDRRAHTVCCMTLGEYLWERIQSSAEFEVAFVWNRSTDRLQGKVPEEHVLVNLDDFAERHVT